MLVMAGVADGDSADCDGDDCRLRHGVDGGGVEEGGGQAEGAHPLTGGRQVQLTCNNIPRARS